MNKMSALFLNDFYKCKYAAEVQDIAREDEQDHGERREALEKLANEIERREFISKKTFLLRYKTQYGASHQEAVDLFF